MSKPTPIDECRHTMVHIHHQPKEKHAELIAAFIEGEPGSEEAHKTLRRIYTETWTACAAKTKAQFDRMQVLKGLVPPPTNSRGTS